jgi:hypothetical protein
MRIARAVVALVLVTAGVGVMGPAPVAAAFSDDTTGFVNGG